jgi:hypothetical protein
MSYQAQISRENPTAFLFLVDQSGSMEESMDAGGAKAKFVADVLNKTLVQLIPRCTRADGVRNYFEIGVIGYSGEGVTTGFQGELGNDVLAPISKIEAHPLRIDERKKTVSDGAGGFVEQNVKFPVWFEPKNSGGTPMCAALTKCAEVLVEWCDKHPKSYPPTLIHVTDGMSTDGNPEEIAQNLQKISTQDGECLLFNLHVSASSGESTLFPSSESVLPDQFSKMLFRMSSVIPDHLLAAAKSRDYKVDESSRFFGYKADIKGIVDFFNIGTQAAQLDPNR